jgi:hypothetical protein
MPTDSILSPYAAELDEETCRATVRPCQSLAAALLKISVSPFHVTYIELTLHCFLVVCAQETNVSEDK